MNYKNLILCGLLITALTGKGQSVEELDKRNGFKDIKLNSEITQYDELEFKKKIKDEVFPDAKLYVNKKGSYTTIGNIPVIGVEVSTYKDRIFQIRVETDKNTNLYKGLATAFGEGSWSLRKKAYVWSAENLSLVFRSVGKNKESLELIYYSYVMVRERKEEKKEYVREVSDDF
ncbi:MAG: hypothetical protein OEX02_00395 [Cyclobacteriaceae bacterium]|nr:hypothetical protein [Cyclobacteriaceae bacterium]